MLTTSWPIWALLFSSLAVVLTSIQYFYFKKQIQKMTLEFNASTRKLKREINTTARGAYGMGQRVLLAEKRLQLLSEEHSEQYLNQEFPVTGLEKAEELIDSGVDADTVASKCGLSRSEASLMALVRKQFDAVSEDELG